MLYKLANDDFQINCDSIEPAQFIRFDDHLFAELNSNKNLKKPENKLFQYSAKLTFDSLQNWQP